MPTGPLDGNTYNMPMAFFETGTKVDYRKTGAMTDMVATNEHGVAELTAAELETISKADGKAGLTAADFQAYGVNATVAKDLVALATTDGGTKFQTVGLNFQVAEGSYEHIPPRLETGISTPLKETIVARGIEMPKIDPTTKKPVMITVKSIPEFDKLLQTMTEPQRNTLLASITGDVGAEMWTDATLTKNDAIFDKYLGTDPTNPTAQTLPASMTAPQCADAITAYTTHPNISQGNLNAGLNNLGAKLNAKGNETLKKTVLADLNAKFGFTPPITDLTNVKDRNMLIDAQREKNIAEADGHANNLYKTFGGSEPKPISIGLGSGDGTGTTGRNGKPNRGIALNRYGSNSGFNNVSAKTVSGVDQARVTFKPTAADKPMTINVLPSGANSNEAAANLPDGNRLSIEYKDKNGNAQSVDFITFNDPVTNLTKMKLLNPITDPNVKFDENTGTLTFAKPGTNPISVVQRSGGTGGKDEIFANLTLTGCTQVKNTEVNIALRDHFKPNQWEVDVDKLPDFKAKVQEVVAYRKANHVPEITTDVTGNGAGTTVNGEVVKRSKGDYGSGGYKENGTTSGAQSHLRYSELSFDMKTGKIEVDSFTDPVVATLGKNGYQDQVDKMREKDASLTENDILSGLRAFSVFEAYEKEAKANGDSMNKLKTLEVPIGANGAKMTYDDYKMFNDQQTALEKK